MHTSITVKHDGEPANEAELAELGFSALLSDPRDLRTDRFGGRRFDFVGFVANKSGDLLAVVPKHFKVRNESRDLASLFAILARSSGQASASSTTLGAEFTADYPLAAFMATYDHYRRWGLDIRFDRRFRTAPPGRIDWGRTISRGSWVPARGGPIPYPAIYDSKQRNDTFLSECSIFVIDYTLERFGFLLDLESTGKLRPAFDLDADRDAILARLWSARAQTFRDSTISLIDSLITFFGTARRDVQFVMKKYNFHLIWEEAVRNYLNRHFVGIDEDGAPEFATPGEGVTFSKRPFNLNRVAPGQKLEPDFYAVSRDGRTQYVLDAKYYTALTELDYKQLSYTLLLDGLLNEDGRRRFDRTYSALLLPSERAWAQVHFAPEGLLTDLARLVPDLRITAAYLDARDVLVDYSDSQGSI